MLESSIVVSLVIQGESWEGAGHSISGAWLEYAGAIGGLVLLAWFLLVMIKGILRRSRYRAVEILSSADVGEIHDAIIAAEKRTVGEILPVIVERSDRHPAASWLSALFFVLLGSSLLASWLPWERPVLLLQGVGPGLR